MKVINGNNIDILKQYPDNYFDAIVTDPPYGLGKEPNAEKLMKDWIEKGYHEITGTGFMGKEWDAFIPQPIFWKEVFRVLKHGGHVLSFFGTRTYDWGVMSMRFAGFEVRDCIQWLYGSGFPKSHNISKALDGILGKQGKGFKSAGDDGRKSEFKQDLSKRSDYGYVYSPTNEDAKQWEGWGSALKPANEPIVLARKPLEKGLNIAENVLKWGTGGINIDGCRVRYNNEADEKSSIPGSLKSNQKNSSFGIGEGHQHNTEGRFPANLILTHHEDCECIGTKKVKGTSGYETDGEDRETKFGQVKSNKITTHYGSEETVEDWNCVDDCPIKILDEQSGVSKSTGGRIGNKNGAYSGIGVNGFTTEHKKGDAGFGDKGGSSRFFYVAKASKSERNKGLEKEKWFYDLELVTEFCSFTEQNLFIWQKEEQNQSMDLNGEVQQQKVISEDMMLIVEGNECNTILNGKNTMALFPKVIKFTTKMESNQIIELKTLNYYQHLNISDCIADVLETNKVNGLNLAENVGIKNLLKLIFIKDEMGFPLGVRLVAKKTPLSTSVKDAWQKSNIHSTVKPIKLMQYLVRLITPPNGIVLDPFCGSGTTGVACKLEGFQFIGLEQDAEYCKIAQARIDNYIEELPKKPKSPEKNTDEQLNIFEL
jgi:DNA modification methylase